MSNTEIDYLVNRFYNELEHQQNASNLKQKGVRKPEHQSKDRKTFINNFTDVCSSINREQELVSAYIAKELKIETSISGAGILIIHGSYKKNSIEELIRKYVIEFVQCTMCKSLNTKINKRNKITYLDCDKCRASVSI